MEMTPGAIPHPGRVPEQRLMSPKLRLRRRRRCETFRGWIQDDLGFSCRRQFIGRRAMPEGTQGAYTIAWRGQGGTRAMAWCGCLPALLCLPFGLRVRDRKIGTSGFVSSNSKNISHITFLKYKNKNWHCGILLIG
jgi:hypothetical protein